MKRIVIFLILVLIGMVASAKQYVQYFRYNFSFNVAQDAKCDLDDLIAKGNKIVSFSLDYSQKCMIVVYEDKED